MAIPGGAFARGIICGAKLERLPPSCPLNVIRHSLRKEDGYTVENVAFESLPGFWVTGNLYLPANATGKIAGMLFRTGTLWMAACWSRRRSEVRHRQMGAAVFAYDMVGYGESTPVPHLHSKSMRLQTYNSLRALISCCRSGW